MSSFQENGTYIPINLGLLGVESNIYWYDFDANNNQLLIFWSYLTSVGNEYILRVSALPLPHPDSTRAMMDLIRAYGSIDPPSEVSTSWAWLLLVLPLSLVGFTVWYRIIKKPIGLPFSDEQTIDKPLTVTFCYVNKPKILLNGVEAKIQFSDLEFGLLLWLYWKYRRGEPYQITDTIEHMFWHKSPNIDYVRKQRNMTLRRLNEHMIELIKLQGDVQKLITDRPSISDKRKREYSLNLNGLVVGADLDTIEPGSIDPSKLLDTFSGLWVEQIRSDYLSMNLAS